MRLRGLMVAALILAALAAGLYFSNKQKSAEAAKPPADASPKIVALSESDVTKVDLKKKDAPETILDKNNAGKWQLSAPDKFLADQDAATQLVNSAATVASDRVVEDKAADVSAYGLKSPALEDDVTTKNGKTTKLKIGDDTPTNSGAYAML